jgi:hypothetical protein
MHLKRRLKNLGSPTEKENGGALAMVLAIFVITMLLSALAANSVVNGLSFTNATRAGVQSQESAEGGIALVLKSLTARECHQPYTQGSDLGDGNSQLNFTVLVYSRATPTDNWTAGCPGAGDHYVRFVSTGTPVYRAINNSVGDSRTIEAIYNWSPAYATTTIKPTGPAIYSYDGALFSGSSQLNNPEGSPAVIDVAHGDAGCTFQTEGQSAIYNANVVVQEGSWGSGGSCIVNGNVWAYNDLTTAQSSQINGSTWSSSVTQSESSIIWKNVWAGGPVTQGGSSAIYGAVTAASTSGNGQMASSRTDPSLQGVKPSFPDGTKPVPPWTDYPFKRTDWPSFAYTNMTEPCNVQTMQDTINKMAVDTPGPSILDTRDCLSPTLWGAAITLPNDVAIIAGKQFYISGGGPADSSDGITKHKLWIIQPDDVADKQPTCPTGGYLNIGLSYAVADTISTMIYTPCKITLGQSATWRGQFYSGQVLVAQSAILTYVPGGLPGVDLSDGTASATDGGATYFSKMGDRISIRNLDPTH